MGSSDEISIALDRFGVGNAARSGDWAGIRLRLRDNGTRQRQVLIRVSLTDPDGDVPAYELERTLNPGVEQGEWVYPRLSFRFRPGDAITVSVHEAIESGEQGFQAGRVLGRKALVPPGGAVRDATEGLIGVLGQRALGLLRYQHATEEGGGGDGNSAPWHPYAHERTQILVGITPSDLPDRWMGLAPMSALVWGQGEVSELRGERAKALRDWIRRGGHLVVILPPVGQTWSNPASNELHDLMPLVAVQRQEGVDLTPYRPLLNSGVRRGGAAFPRTGIVHTFRVLPDAKPAEAMPILNGPDGRCVVVRRLVGAGAITLVGLDLNQTALAQGDNIDAEVFWHRVLGRSGRYSESQTGEPHLRAQRLPVQRHPWAYDDDVARLIVHEGRAAAGVLAGFIVFAGYWLLAGPVGYAWLKSRGWSHHSWVAFGGLMLVFTGIAWGGASLLRPGKAQGRHLTFVDHIYGQDLQRARLWASVLVPWYGPATFEVEGAGEEGRPLSAIVPWDAPEDDSAWSGFPDSRTYTIQTRRPDRISFPMRSTSKVIQVDWAGGPSWEMPLPTGPDGHGSGMLTLNEGWSRKPGESLLTGTLVHNLPGTLREVTLIVVRSQMPLRAGRIEATPLVVANAFSLPDWPARTPIDLGVMTKVGDGSTSEGANLIQWLNRLRPEFGTGTMIGMGGPSPASDPAGVNDRLAGLAVFPLLPSPNVDDVMRVEYVAQRRVAHTWDLGRWFTQPCVIIIGHLTEAGERGQVGRNAPSPVPLKLDGEPLLLAGRTVVRWVYPLPAVPPAFQETAVKERAPDGTSSEQPVPAEATGGGS
jgi:hypothetical protein